MTESTVPAETESILFVCTGNICRSPFMELTLRDRLHAVGLANRISVQSAGTHALVGAPPHSEVRAELDRRSVGFDGFSARQLTKEIVLSASLVLTAAREHSDFAGTLAPRMRDRIFTLRQFRRLMSLPSSVHPNDGLPVAHLALMARRNRGLGSSPPTSLDIEDPMGGNHQTFTATFEAIDPNISAVLTSIVDATRHPNR